MTGERAIGFFTKVLGQKQQKQQNGPGICHLILKNTCFSLREKDTEGTFEVGFK